MQEHDGEIDHHVPAPTAALSITSDQTELKTTEPGGTVLPTEHPPEGVKHVDMMLTVPATCEILFKRYLNTTLLVLFFFLLPCTLLCGGEENTCPSV